MDDDKDKLTLSVEEAAAALGLGRAAAYLAAARGELPTVRIGRRLLVPKAALHELLRVPSRQRLEDSNPVDR
jgi:excisionase family DNA binding protein